MVVSRRYYPETEARLGEVTDMHRVELRCSFCGKAQSTVEQLVAGQGVYVCNECVNLMHDIIHDPAEIEKRRGQRDAEEGVVQLE